MTAHSENGIALQRAVILAAVMLASRSTLVCAQDSGTGPELRLLEATEIGDPVDRVEPEPGPGPVSLNPDSAASLAATQSPFVIAAAAGISVTAADLDSARLVWRPTLSLQATAIYGRGEPTSFQAAQQVGEPGVPANFAAGPYVASTLNLSLPLYYSGTLFGHDTPEALQAKGNKGVAEATLDLQIAEATNLVAKAYFNAVLAAEQLGLYEQEYASRLRQLEAVLRRTAAREARPGEQLMIDTALANARAGVNTATSLHETSLVQLRSLLGMPGSQKLDLAALPEEFPALPELSPLIDGRIDNHPLVRIQQAALAVARGELLEEKAIHLPSVNLVSSLTGASGLANSAVADFYSIGVTLSVPIDDFGQSDAGVRGRNLAVIEAEQKMHAARAAVMEDLAAAYHVFASAKEQIPPALARLREFQDTERSTRAKYEQGLAALEQMLTDESRALIQQIALINVRLAAWGAYADLVSVAGTTYSSDAFSDPR